MLAKANSGPLKVKVRVCLSYSSHQHAAIVLVVASTMRTANGSMFESTTLPFCITADRVSVPLSVDVFELVRE